MSYVNIEYTMTFLVIAVLSCFRFKFTKEVFTSTFYDYIRKFII